MNVLVYLQFLLNLFLLASATVSGIRLVNGPNAATGRVEVKWDSYDYGTVCDDGFTNNDAKITCIQASYTLPSGYASYYCCAKFGQGTGGIRWVLPKCAGTETSLASCPTSYTPGVIVTNCGHNEDIGCLLYTSPSPRD